MSKVVTCRKIIERRPPKGVYSGTWGGYVVKFTAKGSHYEVNVDTGIRTPNAPCKITVTNDDIKIELADV